VRFGEVAASARVELKADGTKVTGTLNELKLDGTFEGDRLRLTATRPDGSNWGSFDGRLQGDDLAGAVKQGNDEFNWKARRDIAAAGLSRPMSSSPRSSTATSPARSRPRSASTPATASRPIPSTRAA
jgi:hypothetical protein